MKSYEFKSEGFERHTCNSSKEGEWIIFQCPKCGYVSKMNPRTHEMKVIDIGDETVLHSGMHVPIGIQPDKYHPN